MTLLSQAEDEYFELLLRVPPRRIREAAYDEGYSALGGEALFLESPYFNRTDEMSELLGNFWIDGHVQAIIDFNNRRKG